TPKLPCDRKGVPVKKLRVWMTCRAILWGSFWCKQKSDGYTCRGRKGRGFGGCEVQARTIDGWKQCKAQGLEGGSCICHRQYVSCT
ncbi:hypothetical protein LSAT2_031028, partial [Lamellibrachia satsuma]